MGRDPALDQVGVCGKAERAGRRRPAHPRWISVTWAAPSTGAAEQAAERIHATWSQISNIRSQLSPASSKIADYILACLEQVTPLLPRSARGPAG